METENIQQHRWDGETIDLALKVGRATGNGDDNGKPGFVWLGGFKSDMAGTKADVMVSQCAKMGADSLRFDYSGHGLSGGQFVDGTISRWVDESLSVILQQTSGPQVLVGSSMGGWIALRLAQELAAKSLSNRLAGLLLIAPAPDFTQELMERNFTEKQILELRQNGFIAEPSQYSDEPNIITRKLIDDGRKNLILDSNLEIAAPVRVLQGMQDPDVPYQHVLRLIESLPHDDVTLTLIKDGDHRLSREDDLRILRQTMSQMICSPV